MPIKLLARERSNGVPGSRAAPRVGIIIIKGGLKLVMTILATSMPHSGACLFDRRC